MTILPEEVRALLQAPQTTRLLATVGRDGAPEVVLRDTLTLQDDGLLAFAETQDSNQSSKNLVHAIWSNGLVGVALQGAGQAWHLRARPVRCLIAGPLFKHFLIAARSAHGADADISSVWLLQVESVRNDAPEARRTAHEAAAPWAGAHLDCARFLHNEA